MLNKYLKNGKDRRRNSTMIPETSPPVRGDDVYDNKKSPEFIRLPKSGHKCEWTGLSRGSLNDLILGPDAPVKSVVIRQPGATRGVRLIHYFSLLSHLEALMHEQMDNPSDGKEVHHD